MSFYSFLCQDNVTLIVAANIAEQWLTIKLLLQDCPVEMSSNLLIPVTNIPAPILQQIVNYYSCLKVKENYHSAHCNFAPWEERFMFYLRKEHLPEFKQIMCACDYLDATQMINFCCRILANQMFGKFPGKIEEFYCAP